MLKTREPSRFFVGILYLCVWLLLLANLPARAAQSEIIFTEEEQAFIQKHPIIQVGGEMDWAPWDFVENGQHKGVASDYLDLISARTGLKFNVVTGHSWSTLLSMTNEKKLDLLPVLSWSEARARTLNYTQSFMRIRHFVFVRSTVDTINSYDDLKGKTVAIPRGYSLMASMEKNYPLIRIKPVSDLLEAIDAVITNRADAVITSTPIINYYLKENDLSGLKPAFPSSTGINDIHMATRQDMPLLRDIIQKALDSVDELTHNAIMAKWAGMNSLIPLHSPELELSRQEKAYLRDKGQITACIDPNWMPYEGFINGKHSGMSADYLAHFSELLNIPIQVIPSGSWKQSLLYAKNRHCDILPLASNREERRSYLNFSAAYIETSLALATRNDAWFYSDFSEIQGEKIGIISGYSPGDVIRKKYPKIELVELASIQEGLERVRQGELLGFLDALPSLSYHIQQGHYGQLKISGKFEYNWNVGVAARNDEPLLVSVFNKVIAHTSASTHQKIRNNWLAVRYEEAVDYSLLWKSLSVFVVILFLMALRFRQIVKHRNEISRKNAELALINSQLEQQTEAARHMAFHDLLTGLPNRSQLLENLDHAMKLAKRQERKLAALFLDLDRFKYINDSLGHHIGDELLKEVAARVQARLRSSDTLARLGGDEFVILLESLDDDSTPAKVAQDIIDTLQQPLEVAGYHLNISASIGIAFFPDDAEDIHNLIKNADNAMYQAKELGRNRFRYYTRALSEETDKRLQTESALREALQKDQFHMVFQPIIDLKSMEVSHAEALIRWDHPELGFVSPEYFIPIAEENGLINDIGLWVARQACHAYKGWLLEGLILNSVAINVSSVQFKKGDLGGQIREILAEEGLDARAIEIEITERYLMDQTEHTIKHLSALKDAGHLISVDDFGVGYSSMSYMKRLPLDIIKIDRSFITDLADDENDRQISQAIISLSHSLGYRVTAEGVENPAQLAFLEHCRCDFAQGYLFSRPVTEAQFIETVAEINERLRKHKQGSPDLAMS
ncbi:EAL domain-containing protein [Pontibacterium sp.]|uniref:EAL domain-containing protein n=1 Tax=Pontibacterium sp. TaxID=2036026 RepID=UPI0035631BE7